MTTWETTKAMRKLLDAGDILQEALQFPVYSDEEGDKISEATRLLAKVVRSLASDIA